MATQTSVLGLSKPAGNENALVSVLNSDMDLIDAEAGKVRNNIAATYSASSSYAVGDLCIYNGILYKCNTAIGSGGETWNASHWTQITIDGELTALNGKFPTQQTYSASIGLDMDEVKDLGALTELVPSNGKSYGAITCYSESNGNCLVMMRNISGSLHLIAKNLASYHIDTTAYMRVLLI